MFGGILTTKRRCLRQGIIMNKFRIALLTFVAAIACTACMSPARNSAVFEYKVLAQDLYSTAKLESQLDALGDQGWIVCSSSTSHQGDNTVPRVTVILRRVRH